MKDADMKLGSSRVIEALCAYVTTCSDVVTVC